MNRRDISKDILEIISILCYNKDNEITIKHFIDTSNSEEELTTKLKKAFPGYESIHRVRFDCLLPTGQMGGGIGYVGEGIPKECPFTSAAFARDWQKRINRSAKIRQELNINVLDEKCPYCRKKVFECNGHKWCNGYPDCEFENKQREKEIRMRRKMMKQPTKEPMITAVLSNGLVVRIPMKNAKETIKKMEDNIKYHEVHKIKKP